MFASNSEAELINSDCGAAACRIEIAFDQSTTDANFADKLDQLNWVRWGNVSIKDGQAVMYISANAAQMIEPSNEE